MHIIRVEPFHVNWGRGKSAWVRIWTDEGQYGLGEASPMGYGDAALTIIARSFAPALLQADPLDHAVIQNRLFHHDIKVGPGGALAAALAAVDIALWDLKGKILGQPIYKLLGGAWRTELPFYASIGGNARRTVDEVCREVERWMQLGPALVKIRFDADKTTRDLDLPGDMAKARAVRKLVGGEFPLAFDGNNNYSAQGAVRLGRVLEELGYMWFEEPVQSYDLESLQKVARMLEMPIAAGEQTYTLQELKQLIEAGAAIVQPDIIKTGGFTGLSDMAALARAYGVDFLPHQTQPTVGHTANLHFAAALAHAHYPCEYSDASGRQDALFVQPPRRAAGKFILDGTPGLGLMLVEEELQKRILPWPKGLE